MSLRRRLTVAGGGAVFVALAIASLVIYFAVRSNLHDQIDFSLIQLAQDVAAKSGAANAPQPATFRPGSAERAASSRPAVPRRVDGPVFGSDGSGYFQVIPNLAHRDEGDDRHSRAQEPSRRARRFVPWSASTRRWRGDWRRRISGTFAIAAWRCGCTRCTSRPRATGSCGPRAR